MNFIAKLILVLYGSTLVSAAAYRVLQADFIEGVSVSRNYIKYGNFENPGSISYVTSYADAAATSPVDGTGGSPVLTCTRTTSSPLRGDGSFLITKDAANRQGNGCAIDFTIDRADSLNPVMQAIVAEYEVASGTFAVGTSSDIQIWIYDKTTPGLIQPINYFVDGSGKIFAQFAPTYNVTSYRLIIHQATTSASAYTLKLDSIEVGPMNKARGPPITDWVSYTPTGTITTNATYTGKWRRVGDSMEVEARISFGGTNTENQNGTFTLPTGYSIDTSKILSSATDNQSLALGTVTYADVTVTTYHGAVTYHTSGTSVSLRYFADDLGTGSNLIASTAFNPSASPPFTIASGDFVLARFMVPINGWQSNVTMSSTDSTVAVNMLVGGSVASTTSGNIVVFPTISGDSHSGYSTSTGRYTVRVQGWYESTVFINGTNANIGFRLYVNASGSNYLTYTQGVGQAGGATLIYLRVGDLVDVRPDGTTGSMTGLTLWSLHKDPSGSGSISLDNVPTAKAYCAANNAIANLTDVTVCSTTVTELWDNFGAFSAGVLTAPWPGRYEICASVNCDADDDPDAGESWTLKAYVDNAALTGGGTMFQHMMETSPSTYVINSSGCTEVRVNAGQTIRAIARHNFNGSIQTSTDTENNWVSITWIGP